jgi:hypothetical protein
LGLNGRRIADSIWAYPPAPSPPLQWKFAGKELLQRAPDLAPRLRSPAGRSHLPVSRLPSPVSGQAKERRPIVLRDGHKWTTGRTTCGLLGGRNAALVAFRWPATQWKTTQGPRSNMSSTLAFLIGLPNMARNCNGIQSRMRPTASFLIKFYKHYANQRICENNTYPRPTVR